MYSAFSSSSILDGEDVGSDSNRHLVGMVSGAPTSVVVPLRGSLEVYVDKYLQTVYTSSDDIDIAKKSQDIWYGVIDGCQLREALVKLGKSKPS